MKWTATAVNGKKTVLTQAVRTVIKKSVFTPAHSFSGEFILSGMPEDFKYLQGFDGGELIFEGPVDEQQVLLGKNGATLFISARSRAALLLDNEAMPGSYYMPTLADIVKVHCAPYGFTKFSGEGKCPGAFTVGKGMTEWDALEQFCRSVIGVLPQIADDGTIDARGGISGESLLISNREAGGLRFSSAKLIRRSYGVISEVKYKLVSGGDYGYSLKNAAAEAEGSCARRLINLSGEPEWIREYLIHRRINDSTRDYFRITAVLEGVRLTKIGVPAVFSDSLLGRCDDMAVSGIECRCDGSNVRTLVTLHPKKVMTAIGGGTHVADKAAL